MSNKLCIVIPCYNEEVHLRDSVGLVCAELHRLIQEDLVSEDSKILLVDDGSSDNTWDAIKSLARREEVMGIRLLHNVGHQNALLAGLSVAVEISDVSITLDADLQDDIGVMDQMITKWQDDKCDVVYGVRNNRDVDDPTKRDSASEFYYWLSRFNKDCIKNAADFRLLSKRAMLSLLECKDKVVCLRAMIPDFKLKSDVVYYARKAGVDRPTSYTNIRMVKLALAGFLACRDFPVKVSAGYGICVIVASALLLIFRSVVPAMFDLVLTYTLLLGLGGAVVLITTMLGVILWEVKGRPQFTIMERVD